MSSKSSPITVDDVRNWAQEMVNGNMHKLLKENVDENPAELNEASERHRTKAVVEMKGSAVLKSNGKKWNNYFAYVAQFDNTSKKIVKVKVYQDSAAVNKAFEE
ncbi:hypothetical protein FRB96_003904 [Tulasnella sp. 330]|nr:hypothetical protein FRB96_003904 [Tulasnella sp. 330]